MDAANAIELRDVVKTFGARTAVNRVSLAIPAGSIYGLIGPNGAGKTTTFSMVAGFLRPTSGTVEILGHSPQDVPSLAGRVGVLPQDAVLPPFETVGAFLTFLGKLQGIAPEAAVTEAQRVLMDVGGGDWWGMRCGKLSHGMAKRVGVAQALLGRPAVVMLDEPTAGLDPKVAYQLRQFIKGLRGAHTVVVSSHNLQELEEFCDGAAIMDRGALVSAGSMAQLTSSGEEVRVQLSPGPVPLDKLRLLALVRKADFDTNSGELRVQFDPRSTDAETVIAEVLKVLLAENARIAGVAKGRRLEQRVMELT